MTRYHDNGKLFGYALGAGVAVFVLSFASGIMAAGGSAKAIQTTCAASGALAGYLLWPLGKNGTGNSSVDQAAWLICVGVASVLAMAMAAPTGGSALTVLRLGWAVVVMLFFLQGLTAFVFNLFRDRSGATFIVLALIGVAGAAPIYLGPWVEFFAGAIRLADFVIACSPLTYFAVFAEYDYLREQWFYTRTPFGAYPFGYPGQLISSGVYIAFGVAFRFMAASSRPEIALTRGRFRASRSNNTQGDTSE